MPDVVKAVKAAKEKLSKNMPKNKSKNASENATEKASKSDMKSELKTESKKELKREMEDMSNESRESKTEAEMHVTRIGSEELKTESEESKIESEQSKFEPEESKIKGKELDKVPSTYFLPSILTLVFCCCPAGTAAVYFSFRTKSSIKRGALEKARKAAHYARMANFIGILLGGIFAGFLFLNALRHKLNKDWHMH